MKYNMNILKKTLQNGMRVCLVQKKEYKKSVFMLSTPAGGMDVEQMVDGNEYTHRSGCAHYLEHQMFRLNGKDVTEEFARLQSQTNAFTSYDMTSYYFQTTSDIYAPLTVLMDFVQNLDITEATVEKEKGIILSEYDMDKQSPEQRLIKGAYQSMYHYHPIRQNILGTREDITDMSVEDLSYFYNLNYDPSRLVLVGVTGNDCEEIMDFIENHQKNYPSKIDASPIRILKEEAETIKEVEYVDYMDITTPFICLGYKMKPAKSVKEALKMDMAVQMCLDSLFSPLNKEYQEWMDKRIISQYTGAECDFTDNRGYLLFYAQTEKVKEFIELIEYVVKQVGKGAIDEKVFKALKASYIGQNIRGMDQFDNLAIDITRSYFDKYDYFDNIELVKSITLEDVREICLSLDFKNRNITRVLPNRYK